AGIARRARLWIAARRPVCLRQVRLPPNLTAIPPMDLFVFLAVLAAAAFHAGWNALLKLNLEPMVATSLVAAASGIVAVPFAVVVGLPSAAAWPYVLASVAIHIVYYVALAQAYRFGDLGQVYPIARGAAPLMTAILATLWLDEGLGSYGWAGVIV